MLSDDRTHVPKLEPDVAHLFQLGGNLMYIEDVHYVQFVPWKNSGDFHSAGQYAPFVHEMSAPLHGTINVTLYVSMGHSSKDVTMDFIIREVLFTECFFFPFQLILLINNFTWLGFSLTNPPKW